MKPLSERGRMALVASALLCYLLGVAVMLPHESIAKSLVSDIPPIKPDAAPRIALSSIPALWRDPFAQGLSTDTAMPPEDGDSTLPAVLNTSVIGQVPAITRGGCAIDVLGTFLATDAVSGNPRLVARISENGGSASAKSVGDLVCGDVLTSIDFDGVTVGAKRYFVERDSKSGVVDQTATQPALAPSPSASPSASAAPSPIPAPTASTRPSALPIRYPRILQPNVKVTP